MFCCFVVVVWLDLQCDGDWGVVWLNSGNVKVGESGAVDDSVCKVCGSEDVVDSGELVGAWVKPCC